MHLVKNINLEYVYFVDINMHDMLLPFRKKMFAKMSYSSIMAIFKILTKAIWAYHDNRDSIMCYFSLRSKH